MKEKCPNCGEYKLERQTTLRGCGLILLFGLPIILIVVVPGSSALYWGNIDFEDVGLTTLISMILGLLILIFSYIKPQKTINYKCDHCNYQEKRNL